MNSYPFGYPSSRGFGRRRSNSGVYIVLIALGLAVFAVALTWLEQWSWWFIIADVFSGMVQQGLIPESLTFWQAFKMLFAALAVAVVTYLAGYIGIYAMVQTRSLAAGLFMLGLTLVICAVILTWGQQWLWSVIVPDVFAGMVKAEMLPVSLTFWQGFKLACIPMGFRLFGSVIGQLTKSS